MPKSLVARLTYLIIGLYALTFAALSILEHDSLNTHAFDLGNMDQAVWNTANGRPFEFSNWEGGTSRLAAHVEPILLLVAQFYHLYGSPKTLLVLQTLVISLGALPAFWLARDKLNSEFAGVVFASAYLLAPALETANLADFHAVSLASSFLLFAFYFVHKERYLPFFLFAILAMSTKEQVPLSVLLMGLYIAFVQRRRAIGLAAAALAALWVVVALGIVIPTFNPTKASPYLSRYDHLGGSPREIIAGFLQNPSHVFSSFSAPVKIDYVHSLLKPVLYLSLLSPITFVFALPDLAINLLSNFPDMYTGRAHYGAVIVPFVVISAIFGASSIMRLVSLASPKLGYAVMYVLCSAVLGFSLASYYQAVFLPLRDHLPVVSEHSKLIDKFTALVPPDAAVATSSTINPHLSQRRKLSLFPDLRDAEYILLDVTGSPYPIDTPNRRFRVKQLVDERREWGVLAAEDGFLLLKKGLRKQELPDDFFSFVRSPNAKPQQPLDVRFGEGLRLLGYDLHPGETLHGKDAYAIVTLYWQTTQDLNQDYLLTLFVVAPDGRPVAFDAYPPATTWYPTSRWKVGETIRVEYPRVPLQDLKTAEVQLGVIAGTKVGDVNARLTPRIPSASGGSLRLNGDRTLLRLTPLRQG